MLRESFPDFFTILRQGFRDKNGSCICIMEYMDLI